MLDLYMTSKRMRASQVALVEEPACQCRRCKRRWFPPWVGKVSWRSAHHLTPGELLPGERHGQRNLVGYSPWGCKELDMTETT